MEQSYFLDQDGTQLQYTGMNYIGSGGFEQFLQLE